MLDQDAQRADGHSTVSHAKSSSSNDERIRFVSAEEWVDFSVLQPPDNVGWVAVPPPHDGDLYGSPQDPSALGFLAPDRCSLCHAEIVESFAETAHARTSRLPSRESIAGALAPPANRLITGLDGFYFRMVEQNDAFLQEVYVPDQHTEPLLRLPVAFVFGSGNHGQSYVHWEGDQLCQMHVSYYSEFRRWTNSPGTYQDGTADYARPVTSRCVDCHATWFGHQPRSINRFDQAGWILGVTCVRCHGPAREHVQFHKLQPDEFEAHFIVNPSELGRDRLQEVCAQCHSGGGELRRPAFSYVPGEPLADYLDIDLAAENERNDDPHSANQLGRLRRSACYQGSNELSCVTCHDPHRHERGNTALFSSRCLQCHQTDDCGARSRFGSAIDRRCIECHMPSRRDAEVSAAAESGTLLPLLRDHLIGIWPDVSANFEHRPDKSQNGSQPKSRKE